MAQYNLGCMYADGQAGTQDFIQAHKWLNIAGASGDERAGKVRGLLEKEMTPEQIAEAERLVRE